MKKAPAKALARNFKDVMKHGSRLSYNRSTAVVATCRAENGALLTGLGGMGVGTMWTELDYSDYAERAKQDEAPDFPTKDAAWAWWSREMFG
jgi:hypothetical protein